jgi:hypothetical protein
VIQRLLDTEREPVPVEGLGVEAEADWKHLRTPETYLGYKHGERFASPSATRSTIAAPMRSRNPCAPIIAGSAVWTIGRENAVLDHAGGSIAYRFDARDAHAVLSPGERDPIRFRVLVDGEAPGPSHGADVDEDGNGLLGDGRLYQLVRERDTVRERTLETAFLEPGAEAYEFAFG